jgi:hypothetical protein
LPTSAKDTVTSAAFAAPTRSAGDR